MGVDVLFVTQNLDGGGSQRQLVTLATGLAERGYDVRVATFHPGGMLRGELERAGVPVDTLGAGALRLLRIVVRLARLVRAARPRVLHGYLDVPNLFTLLLRPLAAGARVVWGLRAAYVDWGRFGFTTRAAFHLGCRLARFADLVIANSHAGRDVHVRLGYPAARTVVVPNGIDTGRFAPDAAARRRLRSEWGMTEDQVVVGIVARLDPLKGHVVFLRAAAIAAARMPNLRFVCVGGGDEVHASSLQALADSLGIAGRTTWAGARADMEAVYPALDLTVSASEGEGFSNVVAESMSCGVPCIVSDVGDSARVVGDPALVVAPGDPEALAEAMVATARRLDPALRARCRDRIVSEFGVERLVERTIAALGLQAAPVPTAAPPREVSIHG